MFLRAASSNGASVSVCKNATMASISSSDSADGIPGRRLYGMLAELTCGR